MTESTLPDESTVGPGGPATPAVPPPVQDGTPASRGSDDATQDGGSDRIRVLTDDPDAPDARAISQNCSAFALENAIPVGSTWTHTHTAAVTCQGSAVYAYVTSTLYKRSSLTDGQWRQLDESYRTKTIGGGQQARAQGSWQCVDHPLCRGFGEYKHTATLYLSDPASTWQDSNAEFICSGGPGVLDCLYIGTYTSSHPI